MSRARRSGPALLLLVLALAGCAGSLPRRPVVAAAAPTATAGPAQAAEPAPDAAAQALPPAVTENETFVTIDGVPHYRIGPGDVLDVLLTSELAQDHRTAAVRASGRVTIGFFEAPVAGLTVEQAAREIQRVLAPGYKQLAVDVTVKEYRSRVVSVFGEVGKDGRFALQGRTTLLDLLAEAGGPSANADLRALRLMRRDGRAYSIDLYRLIADGRGFRDLVVDAGDVLFVPAKPPAEERKVFLLGEVQSPGAYAFAPNMRLSHAVALAGGPKDSAALERAWVIRGDLRQPTVAEVDIRALIEGRGYEQDVPLRANDLVVVPRTALGDWNAFLARLKPTLEFLALPLQPVSQYLLLRELVK